MYVCTFVWLQFAVIMVVEYVIPETGKRFMHRQDTIDYSDPSFIWG